MEILNMEQSKNSLTRLNEAVEILIKKIQEQQESYSRSIADMRNKEALQTTQIDLLKQENEKLKLEMNSLQNNTENEQKIQQLQNELDSKTNKINGLQIEIQNLNTALSNRKQVIEDLENKNKELQIRFENINTEEIINIKNQLQDEIKEKEEITQKFQENELKMQEMQKTITSTSENIDNVVARLERILEENGTSNNNN